MSVCAAGCGLLDAYEVSSLRGFGAKTLEMDPSNQKTRVRVRAYE